VHLISRTKSAGILSGYPQRSHVGEVAAHARRSLQISNQSCLTSKCYSLRA